MHVLLDAETSTKRLTWHHLNRRQLLGSAAGVVTTGIAPGIDAARGSNPAEVASLIHAAGAVLIRTPATGN
jgi:hypothetical protein